MGIEPHQPQPLQRGTATQFSAHVCCGQTAGCIKITLGREADLSPGDIVFNGDPALPPKGHSPPPFSAHVCCGQTAGWIKMPLVTQVDLGPGLIVLDGNPAAPAPAPNRGTAAALFSPCLLWPNGRPSQLLLSICSCNSQCIWTLGELWNKTGGQNTALTDVLWEQLTSQ